LIDKLNFTEVQEIANSYEDQQQELKERRDVIAREERRLENRKAENSLKARTDLHLDLHVFDRQPQRWADGPGAGAGAGTFQHIVPPTKTKQEQNQRYNWHPSSELLDLQI
jgi:hypothetical protein